MKAVWCAATVLVAATAAAQELEPRSYAPSPTGTTFIIGGFGRSQGPILMDPSLDVDNVEGDLWISTTGLGHVFDLAGRQARILTVVPIAWGTIEGNLHGLPARQDLAGLVDPRVKLSVGLHGAPALTVSEFAKASRSRFVIGASLTVVPPWGHYTPTQLVNLGYNRWAFKPELGISHQMGRWTIDGYGGVWLFTSNDAFYPRQSTKRQDPVTALQGHVSYTLPRRWWLAFDGTWFAGGQTRVDDVPNADLQRNSRLGTTVSMPLSSRQSVKFVYSTGSSTKRGSAFSTLNITWQLVTIRKRG